MYTKKPDSVKIIQIIPPSSPGGQLSGLGDDGKLYYRTYDGHLHTTVWVTKDN